VLYRNDLLDPTWLVLMSDVVGDGSLKEVADAAAVPRRFYRVRVRME
jgi:hypothetical protein